jgi:hypothetical protein
MAQNPSVLRDPATRTSRDGSESIADLFKDLRDEAVLLVRQEVALAKTEMSEKMARIARNSAYVAAGMMVAFVGLVLILLAAAAALAVVLDDTGAREQAPWLAPLIVGAVVVIAGVVAAMKGINTIKNQSLKPQQTIDSITEDKKWIQNKTK